MTSTRTLRLAVQHINNVTGMFDRRYRLAQGQNSADARRALERSCAAIEVRADLENGAYDNAIHQLEAGLFLPELARLLRAALVSGETDGEYETPLSGALAGILANQIAGYEDPSPVAESYRPTGVATVEALATVAGVRLLFQLSLKKIEVSCIDEESLRCATAFTQNAPWEPLAAAAYRVVRAHLLRHHLAELLPGATVHPDDTYLVSFNLYGDKVWVEAYPEHGECSISVWFDGGEELNEKHADSTLAELDKINPANVRETLIDAVSIVEKGLGGHVYL